MPKSISSVSGYIGVLKTFQPSEDEELFFRGHSNDIFALKPSVFRNEGHRANERQMLMRLIATSPEHFINDNLTFDKLVRAQHYNLPTRLLDLSTNPLMSLYFACSESFRERGQVLAFEVPRRLIHFFSGDNVSCKSNQVYLSLEEKAELAAHTLSTMRSTRYARWRRAGSDRHDTEFQSIVQEYNSHRSVKRLCRVIKDEKSYFEERLEPASVYSPSFVLSKKSNYRISAQSGAFLVYGLKDTLPNEGARDSFIRRIDIAGDKKEIILRELAALGIDQSTVYPELEKVAVKISEICSR